MAMTYNTPKLPFGAITTHRLVEAGRALAVRVEAVLAARRTARQLRCLSPEMLEDIGLTLGDIEALEDGRRR
ncbi:MAG: DUF1127 domain-containing protein [Paracoccaceae bacterium]